MDSLRDAMHSLVCDRVRTRYATDLAYFDEIEFKNGSLFDKKSGSKFRTFYTEGFFVPKGNFVPEITERVETLLDQMKEADIPVGSVLLLLDTPLVTIISEEDDRLFIRIWLDCAVYDARTA